MDYGGPRREFFRLLVLEAAESLFVGVSTSKFFCMNATALQASLFIFFSFCFIILYFLSFCRIIIISI